MNKLCTFCFISASLCIAFLPVTSAQLPFANLDAFLEAIRNFNLFSIPPLNINNNEFQEYALITSLFNNRRGCPGGRIFTDCFRCDILCSERGRSGCSPDIPCRRGCGCAEGYYVHANGFCVPEERCEAPVTPTPTSNPGSGICPGGRQYTQCARCDLFCYERANPPPCLEVCRPGCSCPNNYYINALGECVTANSCPAIPTTAPPPSTIPQPECRGNRVYRECATCDVYCFQRPNAPVCTLDCRRGCACPPNYYLNQVGVCVPASRCPRPTTRYVPPTTRYVPPTTRYVYPTTRYVPPTTRYVPPTTRYVPPTTRYVPPTTRYVPPTTRYVPPTTRYVPPTRFPPGPGNGRCKSNQIFSVCVTCIYVCEERFTFTPDQCLAPCREGCTCNPGEFLFGEDCVPDYQCGGRQVAVRPQPQTRPIIQTTQPPPQTTRPPQTARPAPVTTVPPTPQCYGRGQVYSECIRCELTCENRDFNIAACTELCRPGCGCPDGYILNGGNCVTVNNCPRVVVQVAPTATLPTAPPTFAPINDPCRGQCVNGECQVNGFGRAFCFCEQGYSGIFCTVQVAPTATLPTITPIEDPCGGQCVNGECEVSSFGRAFCLCEQGYAGIFCTELEQSPLFFSRNCIPPCEFPRRCVFRTAAFGYQCV